MVTTLVALIAGTGSGIQDLKPSSKVGLMTEDSECPTSPDVYPVISTSIEENPDQSLETIEFNDPPVTERVLPTGATTAGLPYNHPGWVPLGPNRVGGRTNAILPVMLNGKLVLFAGADTGGIWRSDDEGATWVPTHDLMPNLGIASLAADPNGTTIYAGTGPIGGTFRGSGVLKSTDGWTWTSIEGSKWNPEDTDAPDTEKRNRNHVHAFTFSNDGARLVSGTNYFIWYSDDAAHEVWNRAVLVNDDGTEDPLYNAGIWYLDVHPENDNILIAGGGYRKVLLSVDGGKKWHLLDHPPLETATIPKQSISVCFAKAKREGEKHPRVYAGAEAVTNAEKGFGYGDAQIWTWLYDDTKLPSEQNAFKLAGRASDVYKNESDAWNCIWAGDPEDPNLVVVGGITLHRSKDGGQTFRALSEQVGNGPHADQEIIVAHPDYGAEKEITVKIKDASGEQRTLTKTLKNRMVYVGNDGGMFKTFDIANVNMNLWKPEGNFEWEDFLNTDESAFDVDRCWWDSLNNGYAATQIYHGIGNPKTRIVLKGSQDNGTFAHIPGVYYWDDVTGADGADVGYDPNDDTRYYASQQRFIVYRYERTLDDNGNTDIWRRRADISKNLRDSRAEELQKAKKDFSFIAPFEMDSQDPKVMYGGGIALARVADVTRSTGEMQWKAMGDLSNRTIRSIEATRTLNAPSSDKHSENLSNFILVGCTYSRIYKTSNANLKDEYLDEIEWEDISIPGKDGNVSSLTIDPRNPDIFYATFERIDDPTGNLWKNENGTWKDISKGKLPDIQFYSLTIHPERSDWLYLGTRDGLYTSGDGGESWSVRPKGPFSARVTDLFWMDNTLCVATYGRGIFQVDIPAQEPSRRIMGSSYEKANYFTRDYNADEQLTIKTQNRTLSSGNMLGQSLELFDFISFDDLYGKDSGDKLKNSAFMGDAAGKIHWIDEAYLSEKPGWPVSTLGNKSIFAKPALWKNPGKKQAMNLLVSNSDGLFSIPIEDAPNESIDPAYAFPSNLNIQESFSNEVMDNWAYLATDKAMLAYRLVGDKTGAMKNFEVDGQAIHCTAAPLLAAQTLYVVGQVGTKYKIIAFHPRTGAVLWQRDSDLDSKPLQPVWSNGLVVVAYENGTIEAFEYDTGNKKSQKKSEIGVHFEISSTAEIKGLRAKDNMLKVLVMDGDEFHLHHLDIQRVNNSSDKMFLFQRSKEAYPETAPKNYLPPLPRPATSGIAYIPHKEFNNVMVIDLTTEKVMEIIPLPSNAAPEDVAVDPSGKHVYITASGTNEVYVIETATNRIIETITTVYQPVSVAVSPTSKEILVLGDDGNGGGAISRYNLVDFSFKDLIRFEGKPGKICAGRSSFACLTDIDQSEARVLVYPDGDSTPKEITIGGDPQDIQISPDGKIAVVCNTNSSNGDHQLSVINLWPSLSIVKDLEIDIQSSRLLFNNAGDRVFMTNSSKNIYAIDTEDLVDPSNTSTNGEVDKYALFYDDFDGIAISPDDSKLIVANNAHVLFARSAYPQFKSQLYYGGNPTEIAVVPPYQAPPVTLDTERAYIMVSPPGIVNSLRNFYGMAFVNMNAEQTEKWIALRDGGGRSKKIIAPDGSRIYTLIGGRVEVLDIINQRVINLEIYGVDDIALSEDGNALYVLDYDLEKRDLNTGEVLETIDIPKIATNIVLSPDENIICGLLGNHRGNPRDFFMMNRATDERVVISANDLGGDALVVKFHPDGQKVFVQLDNGSFKIFDTETLKEIGSILNAYKETSKLASGSDVVFTFHPNGESLIFGSGKIYQIDITGSLDIDLGANPSLKKELITGIDGKIYGIQMAPDGDLLYTYTKPLNTQSVLHAFEFPDGWKLFEIELGGQAIEKGDGFMVFPE